MTSELAAVLLAWSGIVAAGAPHAGSPIRTVVHVRWVGPRGSAFNFHFAPAFAPPLRPGECDPVWTRTFGLAGLTTSGPGPDEWLTPPRPAASFSCGDSATFTTTLPVTLAGMCWYTPALHA